jgi:hypothetical protein
VGRFRRLRPSPSMMVAFVALFVAGAGTATAARLITGKQIKNSSITSTDVRNGSLLRKDFKSAQLPRGPQGLPGTAGRAGRDGFGEVVYVTGQETTVTPGISRYVACPTGLVPTGGDAYVVDDLDEIVPGVEIADYFFATAGSALPNAWAATVGTNPGASVDLIIEAICTNSSRTSLGSAPAKSGGAKPAKPRR